VARLPFRAAALGAALATSLGAAPVAFAAPEIVPPPPPSTATTTPVDPLDGPHVADPTAMVRGEEAAYRLYMSARKAFDDGDMDGAAERLDRALRTLPDAPPYARSRGSLAMLRARCDAKRYLLDADLAWLDHEELVLRSYLDRLGEIGSDDGDRERKRTSVQTRLQEIATEREQRAANPDSTDTVLQRSLRGEYTGVSTFSWEPASEDLAWYPRPDDPRPRSRQQDEEEEVPVDPKVVDDPQRRRAGVGLVAGGAVAMAGGVAGLAVMGVGIGKARGANGFDPATPPVERRQQIADGRAGNAMFVGGLVGGGVLLVVGAVLVGTGARRMKRATPSASLGPSGASVAVTFRF
jgi:hypothetical protein